MGKRVDIGVEFEGFCRDFVGLVNANGVSSCVALSLCRVTNAIDCPSVRPAFMEISSREQRELSTRPSLYDDHFHEIITRLNTSSVDPIAFLSFCDVRYQVI